MAKVSIESANAFVALLGVIKDRAVARLSALLASDTVDQREMQRELIRHEAAQRTFWSAKTIVDKAIREGVTEFDETILDAGQ